MTVPTWPPAVNWSETAGPLGEASPVRAAANAGVAPTPETPITVTDRGDDRTERSGGRFPEITLDSLHQPTTQCGRGRPVRQGRAPQTALKPTERVKPRRS